MNKELFDILVSSKSMALFLKEYSSGNIENNCEKLIKQINSYLENEILYGDKDNTIASFSEKSSCNIQ